MERAPAVDSELDAPVLASARSIDLTPQGRMVSLAGLAHRHAPATGVDDPVIASSLVLRDRTGRTAMLMTVDALFIGPLLHARLAELLRREANVASKDVLVLASHTHSAPALDPTKPRLGETNSEH